MHKFYFQVILYIRYRMATCNLFKSTTIRGAFISEVDNVNIVPASATFGGLVSANAGISVPINQTIDLVGGLLVNSTTITPVELSYITGLTSNAQEQIISSNTVYLASDLCNVPLNAYSIS